ncbi:MAG: YkgJ family cysteine cluster protein [Methylovirgula sp.]
MAVFDPANPLGFFHALEREFGAILAQERDAPELAGTLMQQASAAFETNVARQCEGQLAPACRGGCAACCTLRVTATAPEILAAATHLRNIAATTPPFRRILQQRIEAVAEVVGGLDDAEYLALARPCPFIVDGHCVIYELRPLACRGHASFDEEACRAAIAGEADAVPISKPHHLLRAYVQNAMQSALRDAGLAWAIHEFVPALAVALRADAAAAWTKGEDPFAASRAEDVSLEEMAAAFDEIKALA